MAAGNFGSLGLIDTWRVIDNANIYDYGVDRLWDEVDQLLQIQQALVDDMASEFVYRTDKKLLRYGIPLDEMEFQEVDEWGTSDTQKGTHRAASMGLPLRMHEISLQWSKKYWLKKTVQDFAVQWTKVLSADARNVFRGVKRGLYTPTNNLTYIDRLDDGVTLPIRALLNADGEPIPPDEFGTTFDGATHSHYLATASLTAANITALVNTVIEHGISAGQDVRIVIHKNDLTAVSALSGFIGYDEPRRVRGGGNPNDFVEGGTTSMFQINNYEAGLWNFEIPIWVKPWAIQGYILAYVRGGGDEVRPLAYRVDTYPGAGNLVPVDEHAHHPFEAKSWGREFGIGVFNRDKAAILYTGGGSYVAPTIS